MKKLILIATLVLVPTGAWGENFSCSYGKRGACLDYGDKVCSSYAKCVDDNAICFAQYTCGFGGGFVCESKYDDVVGKHNDTINEYNALARKYRNLASDYDDLQNEKSNLEYTVNRLRREKSDL